LGDFKLAAKKAPAKKRTRAKTTTAKSTVVPKVELTSQKRGSLKQASIFTLAVITAVVLLALITYNPADPGLFHFDSNANIQNKAGSAGAYLADVLIGFFGYLAYLIPIAFIVSAFLIFKSKIVMAELISVLLFSAYFLRWLQVVA